MLSAGGVGPLVIVPVLFTVVGLIFATMGFRTLRTDRDFQAVALRAPGTVTDLRFRSVGRRRASGTWFPVVRFDTADGRRIDTEAMYGRRPAPARRGEEVTVLYDPADPTRAALEGKSGGGALGLIFVVVGLTFAALGVAIGGIALLVTSVL